MTEQELRERITAPLEVPGVNGYWGADERTAHLAGLLVEAITRGPDVVPMSDRAAIVAQLDNELDAERNPTPDEIYWDDWDEAAYAHAQYEMWATLGTAESELTGAQWQCGDVACEALRAAQYTMGIPVTVYSGARAYADAVAAHRQQAYHQAHADIADDQTPAPTAAPAAATPDLTARLIASVLASAVQAHRDVSYTEAYSVPSREEMTWARADAAWDTAVAVAYQEVVLDYANDGRPEDDRHLTDGQWAAREAAVAAISQATGLPEGDVRGELQEAAWAHGQSDDYSTHLQAPDWDQLIDTHRRDSYDRAYDEIDEERSGDYERALHAEAEKFYAEQFDHDYYGDIIGDGQAEDSYCDQLWEHAEGVAAGLLWERGICHPDEWAELVAEAYERHTLIDQLDAQAGQLRQDLHEGRVRAQDEHDVQQMIEWTDEQLTRAKGAPVAEVYAPSTADVPVSAGDLADLRNLHERLGNEDRKFEQAQIWGLVSDPHPGDDAASWAEEDLADYDDQLAEHTELDQSTDGKTHRYPVEDGYGAPVTGSAVAETPLTDAECGELATHAWELPGEGEPDPDEIYRGDPGYEAAMTAAEFMAHAAGAAKTDEAIDELLDRWAAEVNPRNSGDMTDDELHASFYASEEWKDRTAGIEAAVEFLAERQHRTVADVFEQVRSEGLSRVIDEDVEFGSCWGRGVDAEQPGEEPPGKPQAADAVQRAHQAVTELPARETRTASRVEPVSQGKTTEEAGEVLGDE